MKLEEILFDIRNVSKQFPGTLALSGVSMTIKKGEIHAICGENGAGKSTLMNILAGNLQPSTGSVIFKGSEVSQISLKVMQKLGVSIVYQERSLVETLSVSDNVFAGRQKIGKFGMIDKKRTYEETKKLLDLLKVNVKPGQTVSELPYAIHQLIEIAKALSLKPEVLILDEPTAAITDSETEILFDVIRSLKQQGLTVIYISHRLAEVFELADRVTVLKDGKYICTKNIRDTNIDEIVMNMVGRAIEHIGLNVHRQEDILAEIRNLSSRKYRDISFNIRKGEILSLTGIIGAGRTELALGIFGADPDAKGDVYIEGQRIDNSQVKKAMEAGIGYLPEDRKEQGLFLEMSIMENIISGNLDAVSRKGIIDKRESSSITEQYKKRLNIVAPDVRKIAMELSGGNQQKLVIAKWLLVNPKLLIIDEPTRGVDVGAKSEIYQLLREFVKEGRSVLVISSDMKEVMSISDRILVMAEGRIAGELQRDEFEEERILRYAAGLDNK